MSAFGTKRRAAAPNRFGRYRKYSGHAPLPRLDRIRRHHWASEVALFCFSDVDSAPRRVGFTWNWKTKKRGSGIGSYDWMLRFAKDPRTEAGLKEFIADAEERLDALERSRRERAKQP